MQQRVNVARALVVQPKLLLLDEPFSALDALTRQYMQMELQRIWAKTQTTAIYITHQISEAILLADQVLIMSARPGHIKSKLEIPLERPRTVAMKRSADFNKLEIAIWSILKEEIDKMGLVSGFSK
jgi:NitT/TauT family transport system ATP-binding protein